MVVDFSLLLPEMLLAGLGFLVLAVDLFLPQDRPERRNKAVSADGAGGSVLDGVALALPALTRAVKLQRRAARVGFDWDDPAQVIEKFHEEIGEIEWEMAAGSAADRLEDEIGDLLFNCANLARKFDVDPETALKRGNAKFGRRFRRIEALLAADGKRPEDATLAEMEVLWCRAKQEE